MKRAFQAIVALQVLFLLAEVGNYQTAIARALKHGRVVTLKVVPVDPRSLFLGNYMDLSYDISELDLMKTEHDQAVGKLPEYREMAVYVWLAPGHPWARPVKVTARQPRDKGVFCLRGIGRRSEWVDWETKQPREELDVDYGLERYYIPEAAGKRVSRMAEALAKGRHQIAVEAVVSKSGKGMIYRVLVDGKPLDF